MTFFCVAEMLNESGKLGHMYDTYSVYADPTDVWTSNLSSGGTKDQMI